MMRIFESRSRGGSIFVLAMMATFFCFVFTAVAHAMERAEGERIFAQAVQAYKDGHFDEAVALDEKIIAADLESPAVYYNLGNAYLRSKELGKAIVNYLRAERLSPRDADIRANLAFARNNVENYRPFSLAGAGKLFVLKRLSVDELKWISLILFMSGGIFFLAGSMKSLPIGRIVIGSVVFFLAWGYFVAVSVIKGAREASHAVILKEAEVKYEPSVNATTYFKLSEGVEVRILRSEDGWFKLQRADGKIGWAPGEFVEKVSR